MRRFLRHAILLLAALQLAGCRQWRGQLEGPRDVLSNPEVRHVRITRTNSDVIEMRIAGIQGDSVYGTVGGSGPLACAEAGPMCNVRIPMSQVGFVETREFSLIRTAALFAVPIGAFIIVTVGNEPCRPLAGAGC